MIQSCSVEGLHSSGDPSEQIRSAWLSQLSRRMTDIEQVIDALLAKWSAGSRKNHLGMLVGPINLVPGQSGTLSASATDQHDDHLPVRPPAIRDSEPVAIGATPRATRPVLAASIIPGRHSLPPLRSSEGSGGSLSPLRAVAASQQLPSELPRYEPLVPPATACGRLRGGPG